MSHRTVYISGPYSNGDSVTDMAAIEANVTEAIKVTNLLITEGYLVFCPHLSHWLHLQEPRQHNEWINYDLKWLEKCDALLRLPGMSKGSACEVFYAEKLSLPVFFNLDDLLEQFPAEGKIRLKKEKA